MHWEIIIGILRIQVLSDSLIRIEERGPAGFEDRPTFNVVERSWAGPTNPVTANHEKASLSLGGLTLHFGTADSLEQVSVTSRDGLKVWSGAEAAPSKVFLPSPSDTTRAWCFADNPRMVPPDWGATAPPDSYKGTHSGWDRDNDARDVYLFLPAEGGYEKLREDFLRLTGPVPLPPLSLFGLIDSRYYPYRQQEAIDVLDEYRKRNIPLDMFVLDTDWRVGASHGYGVNTELLPDIEGFFKAAHDRHVEVMLNDHPEPVSDDALDPEEMRYRQEGLTSLLRMGADYWWFDRNWHVTLKEPAPGLAKEVWGMRVYHDIALAHNPQRRPLIMSNVEGIDNGWLNEPSSPAAHRYPVWWTGDTRADWEFLQKGVENAVQCGVKSLLPYVSEDLAGHHDTPDPELYTRFVQFGALSPVCRLHCSYMLHRFPWLFGKDAEAIVSDYIRFRYRLLPTLYTAAREAFETGTPIVRRLDLYWPNEPEAKRNDQYLLGEDLLVAPVLKAATPLKPIPGSLLQTETGEPGLAAEYFSNQQCDGQPASSRIEKQVMHGWFGKDPAEGVSGKDFSARWTGNIGPFKEGGTWRIGVRCNDGIRLYLDGELVIDSFEEEGDIYRWADVEVGKGDIIPIKLEYRCFGSWHTLCELRGNRVSSEPHLRELWIPPGTWTDIWTGKQHQGPGKLDIEVPLYKIPMFAREGGILFSIPQRMWTGAAAWPEIRADLFIGDSDFTSTREIYEDDGSSNEYLEGQYAITKLTVIRSGDRLTLRGKTRSGQGQPNGLRKWKCVLHGLENTQVIPEQDDTAVKYQSDAPAALKVDDHFDGRSLPAAAVIEYAQPDNQSEWERSFSLNDLN